MDIKAPPTEAEAKRAAQNRKPLPAGKRRGTVIEASEGVSAKDNEWLRLVVAVEEYRLIDFLTATPKGGLRLRHAAAAVGCLSDFEAGHLSPEQFIGRDVIVTTEIERKRGLSPRAIITDYAPAPAASEVVTLRQAG